MLVEEEINEIIAILVKHQSREGFAHREWSVLLYACHAIGQAHGDLQRWREIAHTISQASQKYDAAATDRAFEDGSTYGSYTISTIRHYARAADPHTFYAIAAKYVNLDEHVVFEQSELRDYFLCVWGDNVLYFKTEPGTFYIWSEAKAEWTCDDGTSLKYYIHEECKELMGRNHEMWRARHEDDYFTVLNLQDARASTEELKEANAKAEDSKKKLDQIRKTKLKFNDNDTRAILSLVKSKLSVEAQHENLFDERREVFAFANTCYDLKTNTFFKPTKHDYILTTNGKPWCKPSDAECNRIAALIQKVFPDPEKLRCWVSIVHSALSGKRHEKFFFFTGGGRNGKGFLDEMLLYVLGAYGYKAHLALLTKEFKDGSNVELRNCHKKRLILFTEPEDSLSEQFRVNNIKTLTGDEDQNARGHYSMDTSTKVFGTSICECNQMPALKGKKDQAVISRLVKLDFESTFTNDKELLAQHDPDSGVYIYPEDESLKEGDFKRSHFCAFFQYIVTRHKEYKHAYGELYIPPCAREAALEYLQSEDDFAGWFQEHFERRTSVTVEGTEYTYFVAAKDLFAMYKEATMYTATKEEKRKFNLKRFIETLKTNVLVKSYFREEKKVAHIRYQDELVWTLKARNTQQGLIGWRPKDVTDPCDTAMATDGVLEQVPKRKNSDVGKANEPIFKRIKPTCPNGCGPWGGCSECTSIE